MLAATDWKLAKWKFTNPQAFAAGYLKTGEKLPFIEDPEYRARLNEGTLVIANHSVRVDPLPEHTMMKNPLQRMTQLAKRFRDVWYSKRNALSRRTPSIVVTTLIWRAYEQHVAEKAFPSVFAVLHTLAENLTNPAVLKQTIKDGAKHYTLINPTVPDENLVARWNEPDHAGEADEFFSWATEFRKFIALLEKAEARYEIDRLLQDSLGGDSVTPVLKQLAEAMRSSRERVDLGFTPKLGITAAAAAGAVPLRGHTYHGK